MCAPLLTVHDFCGLERPLQKHFQSKQDQDPGHNCCRVPFQFIAEEAVIGKEIPEATPDSGHHTKHNDIKRNECVLDREERNIDA